MAYPPEEVLERFEEFVKEINLEKSVDAVFYREDYGDYQIILDNSFHCELREKLIYIFMTDPKDADTRREIIYLLKHAAEYEEWEKSSVAGSGNENDIVID